MVKKLLVMVVALSLGFMGALGCKKQEPAKPAPAPTKKVDQAMEGGAKATKEAATEVKKEAEKTGEKALDELKK